MTAAGLNNNTIYEIDSIANSNLLVRMMEMGVLPGKKISLLKKAPFNGPMAFIIDGNVLALRIEEANLIHLKAG
ncbi:FeoA family protein [Cyclobacterium amurskyense]|uniref:FeoA family protein n=1 Tax=Cyclobacterium amurskyense TaxID=320787 RepID=A0A0H4PEB6_9BACT|nr:FeoA family protein [Cyclobacterium amurskyense]AKP52604.1 FeoA family protein [Cyclobacterium amurskyense]|tara:strand:- start:2951 stop:3172 length:222 start_codon:yes stop_codon:yes gene_type:complete